jgi:hypothetical protein
MMKKLRDSCENSREFAWGYHVGMFLGSHANPAILRQQCFSARFHGSLRGNLRERSLIISHPSCLIRHSWFKERLP